MVSERLLSILVCPESRQPLRLAEAALLDDLNRKIDAKGLRNRGGEQVTERLEEGLVREDGRFLYPVRNGIPVMLIDEALPLDPAGPGSA